jgi:ASCH domain
MKALSIQQPWAYLIVQGIKDIENRDWVTSYRGLLLIHAGKQMDKHFPWGQADFEYMLPLTHEYELGGIVGYVMLHRVVTQSDSPWFRGRYGFVLTQRHTVPFMPLRGQLGLFDVPKEIEDEINAIRDERAIAEDAKDFNQIKREWYEYAHEGDETPYWKGV